MKAPKRLIYDNDLIVPANPIPSGIHRKS